MIIIKLQGGLGNQMFQYAAARALTGPGEYVRLDRSALAENNKNTATFTARGFELGIFAGLRAKNISHLIYWTARKFGKVALINEKTFETCLHSADNPSRVIRYLDGYFQSVCYFQHIARKIAVEFAFPQPGNYGKQMAVQIKRARNSVAIHVRRGDYLKPAIAAFHGILPTAYYQRAVEKLETMETDLQYFIFSEDPGWCRLHFKFLKNKATIVAADPLNNWEDMYLMHLCHHQVIANSSYSWWAAWLNENPSKIVVAPRNWFADEPQNQTQAIIPGEWLCL